MRTLRHILPRRVAVPLLLCCIVALGLAVRLTLAPSEGHGSDIGLFQAWSHGASEFGVAQSYRKQEMTSVMPNYPPFSMLLLSGIGHAYRTFVSDDFTQMPQMRIALKLPSIIADIGIVLLLFFFLRKWLGDESALLASFLYALHPAAIYDGAVWGQVDSLYTLFLLAALFAAVRRKGFLGGAFAALAILTKAQAVVLYPLFLVLFTRTWKEFLYALLGGVLVLVAVLLPFALVENGLIDAWNVYRNSVGYYTGIAVGAYNLWWGLFSDASGSKSDKDLMFGVLSYSKVGLGLYVLSVLGIMAATWRRLRHSNNIALIFLVATLLSTSFFLFNTQMHERYLFPAMVFGLPLFLLSATAGALYLLLSLLFLMNLLGVLPYGAVDRALFVEFPALDVALSWGMIWVFALLCVQLWASPFYNRLQPVRRAKNRS